MENDQVANEKADYQVKDSLDYSKIFDFFFITLIVRQDIKQNAENSFKKHYYYERKKHSIVLFSNAVIQPHTMMVIPLDTLVACGTVERPWGLDNEALRAQLDRIDSF